MYQKNVSRARVINYARYTRAPSLIFPVTRRWGGVFCIVLLCVILWNEQVIAGIIARSLFLFALLLRH